MKTQKIKSNSRILSDPIRNRLEFHQNSVEFIGSLKRNHIRISIELLRMVGFIDLRRKCLVNYEKIFQCSKDKTNKFRFKWVKLYIYSKFYDLRINRFYIFYHIRLSSFINDTNISMILKKRLLLLIWVILRYVNLIT